jgi:hypothetical protein
MEVNGHLQTLAALPQGKNPQHPLERRLERPHNQSGYDGEEKKILLSLPETEPQLTSPQPSLLLTKLLQLPTRPLLYQKEMWIYVLLNHNSEQVTLW